MFPDNEFAKQKLQEVKDFALAKKMENDINLNGKENLVSIEDDNSSCTENEDLTVCKPLTEKQDLNIFKWSHEAILLLIEEYRSRVDDFTSGRVSQKKIWEAISLVLRNKGYDVTSPQCMSKFNGLKKTYKSVKDHNSKSGNGTKSWPYYDLIDGLIGAKPFISPVATVSSTGKRHVSESSIDSSDDPDGPPKKSPKFSNKDILLEMQKSRNTAEQNRERRHKEKIEQKQKCLDLFEKLIEMLQQEK